MTDKIKKAPLGKEWEALNEAIAAYLRACARIKEASSDNPIVFGFAGVHTTVLNVAEEMAQAGELNFDGRSLISTIGIIADWQRITSEWEKKYFWPEVEREVERAAKAESGEAA